MADSTIEDLTALSVMSSDDLLLVVDDPSGTPLPKKITRANFMGGTNIIQAVGTTETQTLTNKTITAPTISAPTFSGTTVGSLTNLTLITPALGTPSALVGTNITGTASGLTAGAVTGVTLASGTLTLAGADALTLTTTATTDVTLPTTGTLATLAGSETLSGKTLTAPKLANGGFIADANGNEGIILNTTTSAVNEITVTNSATGNSPEISATGGDTNIDLKLVSKGTGKVKANGVEVVTATDGWTAATGTWTYASASTITVPSGAASIYQVGDKIKWTQTTVKYGVITAVADTLLTIAVNTDYTVANATITDNYYSHQANPIGYPSTFTYTAELFGAGGSKGTYAQAFGLNGGEFSTNGRICTVWASARISNVGSWSGAVYLNLPISPAVNVTTGGHAGGEIIADGGLNTVKAISANVSTTSSGILQFNRTYGVTEPAWTDLAANDWFIVHFSYPF